MRIREVCTLNIYHGFSSILYKVRKRQKNSLNLIQLLSWVKSYWVLFCCLFTNIIIIGKKKRKLSLNNSWVRLANPAPRRHGRLVQKSLFLVVVQVFGRVIRFVRVHELVPLRGGAHRASVFPLGRTVVVVVLETRLLFPVSGGRPEVVGCVPASGRVSVGQFCAAAAFLKDALLGRGQVVILAFWVNGLSRSPKKKHID